MTKSSPVWRVYASASKATSCLHKGREAYAAEQNEASARPQRSKVKERTGLIP